MSWSRLPGWMHVALIAGLLLLVALGVTITSAYEAMRERAWDQMLARGPVPIGGTEITVVDIDRETLERIGPWPWPRNRIAQLILAVSGARPAVIGLDILLVGSDERAPASLLRQIAAGGVDPEIAAAAGQMAGRLPDPDQPLIDAVRSAPLVLGLVLDPDPGDEAAPAVPMLVRGRPRLDDLWRGETAVGALEALGRAARGQGVLIQPGDADARIRRLPMLVGTGRGLRPGLALEMARVVQGASSYLLSEAQPGLTIGGLRLPLPADGMLRLRPDDGAIKRIPVVAAWQLMSGEAQSDAPATRPLAGRAVVIGSSAPELGGLRPAASGDLVPSVRLQAEGLAQLLAGDVPLRPAGAWWVEIAALLLAALASVWAGLRLSPLRAGCVAVVLGVAWLLVCLLAARRGLLIDPLLASTTAIAGFPLAALVAAAETRRREALIRRRFEQHLAPAVVKRIVERPDLLKLEGEAREITALFTDIEGFTSLTERAGPIDLVALLDRYIEGTSRIVVEHGGMVEKIVGDGLHAIFNAPLDLPGHRLAAYRCALALNAFSERMRREPDAARLGFGRTRIGIETGQVIVGDVGGGRRLDYTAHGTAMNTAARLEAANKELGSTICIGPGTMSELPREALRPLGRIRLRGLAAPVEVFEPWPEAMGEGARRRYLAAMAIQPEDAAERRQAFAVLAGDFPDDAVIRRLAAA